MRQDFRERAKNSHGAAREAGSGRSPRRERAAIPHGPECAEKFCVTVQECSRAQTVDKEIREAEEKERKREREREKDCFRADAGCSRIKSDDD